MALSSCFPTHSHLDETKKKKNGIKLKKKEKGDLSFLFLIGTFLIFYSDTHPRNLEKNSQKIRSWAKMFVFPSQSTCFKTSGLKMHKTSFFERFY